MTRAQSKRRASTNLWGCSVMCFECRALGALLPPAQRVKAGRGKDSFSLDAVKGFDFCPSVKEIESLDLRDYVAEVYLEDTLLKLALEFGVELVPIKVESDGSCLPHALSRCLVGKEVLYDLLRHELVRELCEHADFYQSIFQQGMDEETYKAFWDSLVSEAKPTNGEMTSRWLGPEHILAFSNLLQRPILLLDRLEELEKADHRCGLFLPLRHESASGTPLVIGWAGEAKNHFVCLVAPSRNAFLSTQDPELVDRAVRASPDFWQMVEESIMQPKSVTGETIQIQVPPGKQAGDVCMLRDPQTGEEFSAPVPPGKQAGESFEWAVPSKAAMALDKLKRALVHFYAHNSPAVRQSSCKVMFKAISNLVDALLMSDLDKLEKVRALPLDNAAVFNNITSVNGATEIFLAIDFEKVDFNGRTFLRFAGDQSAAQSGVAYDGLIVARDVLGLMRVNDGVALGGGQILLQKQCAIFGPAPAFLPDWEQTATEKYSAVKSAWIFGRGHYLRTANVELIRALVKDLKQDFAHIAKDTDFKDFPWDDLTLYNQRLKHLKCPRCAREQEWQDVIDAIGDAQIVSINCIDCNEELSANHTGQRRMSAFVAQFCRT